jgi:hypothetical protein
MVTEETQDKRYKSLVDILLKLNEFRQSDEEFMLDCIHIISKENVFAACDEAQKVMEKRKELSIQRDRIDASIDLAEKQYVISFIKQEETAYIYKPDDAVEFSLLQKSNDGTVDCFLMDKETLKKSLMDYKFDKTMTMRDAYNDDTFNYVTSKCAQMHNVDYLPVTCKQDVDDMLKSCYVVTFNLNKTRLYMFNIADKLWCLTEYKNGVGTTDWCLSRVKDYCYEDMANIACSTLSTALLNDNTFIELYERYEDILWDDDKSETVYENVILNNKPIEEEIKEAYEELEQDEMKTVANMYEYKLMTQLYDIQQGQQCMLSAMNNLNDNINSLGQILSKQTELMQSQNAILDEVKQALGYIAASQR